VTIIVTEKAILVLSVLWGHKCHYQQYKDIERWTKSFYGDFTSTATI